VNSRDLVLGRVRRALSATGLLVTAAMALGVTACGGGDQASTTTEASTGSSTGVAPTTPHQGAQPGRRPKAKGTGHKESARDRSRHHPVKAAVSETKPARLDPAQRRAAAVVRGYVEALNSRNGGRVCALFVPGALNEVKFPRDRGELSASWKTRTGGGKTRGHPQRRNCELAAAFTAFRNWSGR